MPRPSPCSRRTRRSASHVHPGMSDLLDRLTTPAQVITDLHVTLVQNRLARALVGDERRHTGLAASYVHRWFLDPHGRHAYPEEDHPAQSRAFVADLRAALARRDARDTEASRLLAALLAGSSEFVELWEEHDVAFRRDDRKRIIHPTLGVLEVNCLNLFSEDGRQRLLWFTPAAGTDAAERMELLGVVGCQDLAAAGAERERSGERDPHGIRELDCRNGCGRGHDKRTTGCVDPGAGIAAV